MPFSNYCMYLGLLKQIQEKVSFLGSVLEFKKAGLVAMVFLGVLKWLGGFGHGF